MYLAERGVLVTVEICISASGVFMPPTLIFPRSRAKPELLDDAPPGSKAFYHSSGWIQKEIEILLLDEHTTHTKNLEVIQRGKESGVIIICFPPHTTYRI